MKHSKDMGLAQTRRSQAHARQPETHGNTRQPDFLARNKHNN
jgi:hypothetical protein